MRYCKLHMKIFLIVLLIQVFLACHTVVPSYALVKPMVCCSYNHSLALKEDGTVWAWGNNYFGQLGDSSTTNRSKPVQVPGLQNIKAIACMFGYSMALDVNGNLYGWGINGYGGHHMADFSYDSSHDSHHPVKLNAPISIDSISGCFNSICAYNSNSLVIYSLNNNPWEVNTQDRKTYRSIIPYSSGGWLGLDGEGQLWYKKDAIKSSIQVADIKDITSIDGGPYFAAIKSDGTVLTWRDESVGQTDTYYRCIRQAPLKVNGIDHVIKIKSTGSGAIALRNDGNVYLWGEFSLWKDKDTDETYNFNLYTCQQKAGTLPAVYEQAEKVIYETPTRIPELSAITDIAAGSHYLAVKDDGTVWSWGYNDFGELGDGTRTNRAKPAMIKDFNLLVSPMVGQKSKDTSYNKK